MFTASKPKTFVSIPAIIAVVITVGFCGIFFSVPAKAAASDNIWNRISESSFTQKGERRINPDSYSVFRSDLQTLRAKLSSAPAEFTEQAISAPLTISLPMPDGSMSLFIVTEYRMMEEALAQKFPEFRTYSIKGVSDPFAAGKIDITSHGFHAMVLTPRGTYFVDPYSTKDLEHYISYFKDNYTNRQDFECLTEDLQSETNNNPNQYRGGIVAGPQLRSYRLALAATGEYTVYHGGTVQAGMAAIVTAMNRVNGVYEKDLCARMILIANNDLIVYTNGSTDPYSNNNGGSMLSQNQNNLDNVIGSANYDVGHVFSTGGGGVAFLRCVCVNGIKAQGVTGLPSPIGDPFYIDYVAHEMGHQFGGNHSFNSVSSSCGGGNRNGGTAWEPGSGSTIMAYAGICGGDNLQPNSDDYFHTGNFTEMSAFIQLGNGNTCATITNTGNTPPTITMPSGGWVIPVRTPFKLTGSATDTETPNSLTYCWEQTDLGPAGTWNNPSGNAPIFRSFKPDTSATRLFPKLANILNNNTTIGELLPTYTRDLTFTLTVRDNAPNGGGVNSEFIQFTANAAAGPFQVTYPNTAVTLNSNTPHTITWDVANSNVAPVNCASVNIKLSTNGGQTFPVTLASNTPNDGTQEVTLPSINNATARISVEAVGNIFFDICNANFTISNQTLVSNIGTGIPERFSLSQNYPNPFNPSTKLNFDLPLNSSVDLRVYDMTGREIANLVSGNYTAGSYSVSFDAGNVPSGVYIYVIRAGNFTETRRMTLLK